MPGFDRVRLALAACACLAAAPVQQPPSEREAPEIVVSGRADIDRQIHDFVGALTQAPPMGQLSRFEQAVCPGTAGITPEQRQEVIARMREVAALAGIGVGGPGCRTNIVVVVTPDKSLFLEKLFRERRGYFGEMPVDAIRRLIQSPGPAAAWQIQGIPLDADGEELAIEGALFVNRTQRPPSRITVAARPNFHAAVVVVETAALEGLTLNQLADYAAMRAFARTDPARLGDSTGFTILTVLDATRRGAVATSVTEWDLGFLRALYGSPSNLYAAAQRSEIRQRLRRELERAGSP